jgi:hypothetical protein
MKTYIYTLSDPRYKDCIRYVGKADNPKQRLTCGHLQSASLKTKTIKNSWIKSLKKENLVPILDIIDEINYESSAEWKFWEQHYISLYKTWGFNLTNGTQGGEGFASGELNPNKRPEAREHLRKLVAGRKYGDEFKMKCRIKKLGKLNPNYGHTTSEFQKEKARERKGKTYEDIYGVEGAKVEREKRKHAKVKKQLAPPGSYDGVSIGTKNDITGTQQY